MTPLSEVSTQERHHAVPGLLGQSDLRNVQALFILGLMRLVLLLILLLNLLHRRLTAAELLLRRLIGLGVLQGLLLVSSRLGRIFVGLALALLRQVLRVLEILLERAQLRFIRLP